MTPTTPPTTQGFTSSTTLPHVVHWSKVANSVDQKLHQLSFPTTLPWHTVAVAFLLALAAGVGLAILVAHRKRVRAERDDLVDSAVGVVASRLRPVTVQKAQRGADWNGRTPTRITFKHDHTHRIPDVLKDLHKDLEPLLGPGRVDHNPRRRLLTWSPVTPAPVMPTWITYPSDSVGDDDSLPFATDTQGRTVAWHLDSSSPHALVCGASGGGKSVTLATLILGAALRRFRVFYLDPKRDADYWIRTLIERYASTADEMRDVVLDVQAEVERRAGANNEALAQNRPRPKPRRMVVVVDEYMTLIDKLRGPDVRKETPAEGALRETVLMGRSLRVHVLFATQRPDAAWVGGALRDQLGCRILVGQAKRKTRQMMEIDTDLQPGPGEDKVARGRAVAQVEGKEKVCQVWVTDAASALSLAPSQPVSNPVSEPVSEPAPCDVSGMSQGGDTLRPALIEVPPPSSDDPDTPRPGIRERLRDEKVAEINRLLEEGKSVRDVAATVGVHPATVGRYRQRLPKKPELTVVRD